MRKTSQDGGDSTSITSGIENEMKKPAGILKSKRSSIKRKVQNFSLESDDAVIEPLLQKDKEKIETTKQSAKFNLMPKTKTEANSERETDKDKLISDDKLQKAALSNASDVMDRILPTSNVKENSTSKLTSANAPLHNHMNTNVFSNHDGLKTFVTPKSQILVEIDGSKHVGYSPSPLIFTTAKIHTDGETKHMEPVQMTPGPILSTIEVSVMRNGINTGGTSGNVTSNISAVYIPQSNKNLTEQDPKLPLKTASTTTTPQNKIADTKIQTLTEKIDVKSNTLNKSSVTSSSKDAKLSQAIVSPVNKQTTDHSTDNKCINKITPVTHEAKSGSALIATTKVANNPIKEPKKDKPDTISCQENKLELSKTVKAENLDLQKPKPPENLKSSDYIGKDKAKDTTNTSLSSRQLNRQSIVLDKDDPMSKLKSNIVSPPLVTDSKGFTLDDITKLPKCSVNSVPITSVISASLNNSAIDNKTCASAALDQTLPSLSNNATVNQRATSGINSAVTNNSGTSVSANKSSIPTISSASKTFDSSTTISNTQNTSGAPKVADSIHTAAAMKNTAALNTVSAADNKLSDLMSASMVGNKTIASTTNIVAPNKVSSPTITTKATNKISSPLTSVAKDNKIPSTSNRAIADGKVFTPSSTTTGKLSNPNTSSVTSNTVSATTTTTTADNNFLESKTTAATNKMSTILSTTTNDSKLSNPITTPAATSKTSAPSTDSATGNKVSSSSSILTTTTANKISSTAISSAAIKTPSCSTTNTSGLSRISATNSNSSGKPVTSSCSTMSTSLNTSIKKPVVATSSSASRPINTEKYSSNTSNYENNNSGTANETKSGNTTKSQVTSTLNTKPTSLTTTTKPSKVATVATPTTSSKHTTVTKSAATTAKSASTKTIPQLATTKSTEISPKSSTSNEKPLAAKSKTSTISSTSTSGLSKIPSTTSTTSSTTPSTTPSTLASSISSSVSVEANKQKNSKSKVISNGSKNFKA